MNHLGKNKMRFAIALLSFFCVSFSLLRAQELLSPNQKHKLTFSLSTYGEPMYEVSTNGKELIKPSKLGHETVDGLNIKSGFQVNNVSRSSKDEEWHQPWGENKVMREHYNEMQVDLENPLGVKLTMRFRLFDDGLGFRYEYDVAGVDSVFISAELTEFAIAADGKSWSIPADPNSYEWHYTTQPISRIIDANTPMTFKTTTGIYGSIHEAALYDFPEMTLKNAGGTKLKAALTPWPDGIRARKKNVFETAWRTIQIGERAVDLINSGLILNLNEPCKLSSTDWIEPMKYVGIWWTIQTGIESWTMGPRHGATTANTKKHIDFAHANNVRGVLVEGWNEGWEVATGTPTDLSPDGYYDMKKLSSNDQWFNGSSEFNPVGKYLKGMPFDITVSFHNDANYTHSVVPNANGVFIEGNALEKGSSKMRKTANGVYEYIGALQEGTFKIKTVNGDEVKYYLAENGSLSLTDENGTNNVPEETRAFYLKFDFNLNESIIQPIEELKLYRVAVGENDDICIFNYSINNTFTASVKRLEYAGNDDMRYKFRMKLADETIITFGYMNSTPIEFDNRTASSHYNLYTANADDNNSFTFRKNTQYSDLDFYIIFDSDYYTHGYTRTELATGTGNVEKQLNFLVYPNPVIDNLNIQTAENGFTVEVYSLTGSLVLKREYESSVATLNLSALQQGLYIVRLVQGNAMVSKRIIKH